jgi:hypothetical protein
MKMDRKREILVFVIAILAVSWMPMVISRPVPENTVPIELLKTPPALFPEIEGYSKRILSRGSGVVGQDIFSAEQYSSNGKPILVVFQLPSKGSFDYPETSYRDQKWQVLQKGTVEVGGKNVQFFMAEKNGQRRAVLYWYYRVQVETKFLIFHLPRGKQEIIFVRVETTYDETSSDRLAEVSEEVIKHIDEKT